MREQRCWYRGHALRYLRTFEWLETSFGPVNAEQEIQAGLFRVPIPRVDRRTFREAIANALTHRDYTHLGAVNVRLEQAPVPTIRAATGTQW